jgi:subtilisin family serine protease
VSAAVGLAVVATAPASAAPEGQVRGVDSPTAIDNSYVVVYKDSAAAEAKSTADSLGSNVSYEYDSVFNGFAATMSEQSAKQLAADPDVAFVQQNQVVSVLTDQPNPPSWGLDRIDQRDLPVNANYSYSTTASNVHAYIIDTGMDLDHPAFGGRASSGYDAIEPGTPAEDGHGHGTHVAGTVGGTTFGVAKGVSLVAVRVLNNSGSGTSAQVAAGVEWVTENAIKPAVANMSLGINAVDGVINEAVADSIESGVTYAIASGNSNANACGFSPALVPTAITVNASTNADARASFSNYGNCTDIFAPGQNITSSWLNGGTNTISGTSMAAPHVAGAAALYLADNPAALPAAVQAALIANSTPNKITSPGSGSFNRLLYTGTGTTEPPPPDTCAAVTNASNYTISDNSTVSSPVTVAGCTGAANSASTVAVSIVHTYIGDLVVDLVAPDGSVYNLHNRSGGSTDNLNQTYTVNLSSETANGTWNLRVRDAASIDTGYIDTWTLNP